MGTCQACGEGLYRKGTPVPATNRNRGWRGALQRPARLPMFHFFTAPAHRVTKGRGILLSGVRRQQQYHSQCDMYRPASGVKAFLSKRNECLHVSGVFLGGFPLALMESALPVLNQANGVFRLYRTPEFWKPVRPVAHQALNIRQAGNFSFIGRSRRFSRPLSLCIPPHEPASPK